MTLLVDKGISHSSEEGISGELGMVYWSQLGRVKYKIERDV